MVKVEIDDEVSVSARPKPKLRKWSSVSAKSEQNFGRKFRFRLLFSPRPTGHTSHCADCPQDRRRDHYEELEVSSDFKGGEEGSKIVIYKSPLTFLLTHKDK